MFSKSCKLIIFILFLVVARVFAQSSRPLSVDELFELGVANSLQVRGAQVNANIAGRNLLDKKVGVLPDIHVGVVGGYIGEPSIFKDGLSNPTHPSMPDWSQNYNIEIVQPVYQGNRIKYTVDKAVIQQEIAQLSVEKDVSEIKLLLIGKYLDLLTLYKQQEVIMTSISQSVQRLHDIKGMERNGMVTTSDVLRSELQLSNYDLSLTETKNNIVILSAWLDIALGLDESLVLVPDSSLLDNNASIMPYDNYIEFANEKYQELKISQSYLELAYKERQITQSDYLPKLSLKASNILSRPLTSVSPALDLYANNWNVGLSLSYNLSSLYHNRQKMNMARQNIEFQSIERSKVLQRIRTDVKTYYIKHNESLERIKTLAISVEQANENYRIVLNKYRNHIAILTDLLDASTLQLNARLQLTAARVTAVYTYYQLLRSSGNL